MIIWSALRFKRAGVSSREHSRRSGGEDLRRKRGSIENTRRCNCMQLFSSFLLQLQLCISKGLHGGWLHGNPREKLQSVSLPLPGLIFAALVTTAAHHCCYPHAVHSSGAGGRFSPNDAPVTTRIHLPPGSPQFPGTI